MNNYRDLSALQTHYIVYRGKSPSLIQDKAQFAYNHQIRGIKLTTRIQKIMDIFPIIQPQSTLTLLWDIINLFMILILQIQASMVLVYGPQVWANQLDSIGYQTVLGCMLGTQLSDLIIKLNRGYIQGGYLQSSRKKIIIRYLKMGAWTDIASIISILLPWITKIYETNYFKIVLITKFWNVYQIDQNLFRAVQMRLTLRIIYNLCRLIIIQLVLSHYLGLIFYSIAKYVVKHSLFQTSWILNSPAYPDLYYQPWESQYIFTLYYSNYMLTTIAYGNITPLNPLQTLVCTILMIPYVLILAYIFEGIILFLFEMYDRTSAFAKRIRAISFLILQRNPQSELLSKIKNYLYQLWALQKARHPQKQQALISMLQVGLRIKMLNQAYLPMRKLLLPILDKFDSLQVQELSLFMQQKRFVQNQIIFQRKNAADSSRCVYYIQKGQVSLSINLNGKVILLEILQKGSLFGQLQFFTNRDRQLTAKASLDSVLYQLDRGNLNKMPGHQQRKQVLFQMIDRVNRNTEVIGLKCFSCKSNEHLVLQCPNLFYFGKIKKMKQNKIKIKRPYRQKLQTNFQMEQQKTYQNGQRKLENQLNKLIKLKSIDQINYYSTDKVNEWSKYQPQYNITSIAKKKLLSL